MTANSTSGSCSVALATFNGSRHLGEQLHSLKTQTRLPDEIVICDDGSTDETRETLAEFASSNPNLVRLTLFPDNRGFHAAFEQAISLTSGEFVFLCDQDDVWLPDKIARFEEEFRSNRGAGLVFSDADLIDDEGHRTGQRRWADQPTKFSENDSRLWGGGGAFADLLTRSVIGGSSMAFRARFKPLVLPFPTVLGLPRMIFDWWISLAVSTVADLVPLSEPLMLYRIHPRQQLGIREHAVPEVSWRQRPMLGGSQRRFEAACVGTLAERLAAHVAEFPRPLVDVAELQHRLDHLHARSSLPTQLLPRMRAVEREFRAGRYSKYSSGLKSALLDLVSGERQQAPSRFTRREGM